MTYDILIKYSTKEYCVLRVFSYLPVNLQNVKKKEGHDLWKAENLVIVRNSIHEIFIETKECYQMDF
jgi:hypothetical protein